MANLFTFPEEFDNAAWTKNNVTISADSAAAPNSENTADKIVENTATSGHSVTRGITLSISTQYTLSCYFKQSGRIYSRLFNSTSGFWQNYKLDTGTLGASSGTADNAGIDDIGSGWYRCWMVYTTTSGGSNTQVLAMLDNSQNGSYTGDGSSGVLAWGAVLNLGATPDPYYVPSSSAKPVRLRHNARWFGGRQRRESLELFNLLKLHGAMA